MVLVNGGYLHCTDKEILVNSSQVSDPGQSWPSCFNTRRAIDSNSGWAYRDKSVYPSSSSKWRNKNGVAIYKPYEGPSCNHFCMAVIQNFTYNIKKHSGTKYVELKTKSSKS